jgi:GDP-4-dehydro-6-deoxy-D-mannose reductase
MRILVTGADGFVGGHLSAYLRGRGDTVIAWAGPRPANYTPPGFDVVEVRDAAAVNLAVASAKPDAIIHLAAISSVAQSHAEPALAFEVNALGALHVCAAAKAITPSPRLLLVSSGEVYGNTGERPATETDVLAPTSPYAASKVAAEAVAFQFARSYGMHIVCARPFTHLGRGQAPNFAVPAFARQLVEARRSRARRAISVGNLDPIRDFSHVDDVIAAYGVLLDRGVSGESYNVSSGTSRSMRSILQELMEIAEVDIDVRVDPAKVRASELPALVGDSSKIRALGWAPRRTLRETLRDVIDDAQAQLLEREP